MKSSAKILITKTKIKSKTFFILIIPLILILVCGIISGIFIVIKKSTKCKLNKGAIVTNGLECAAMGREIFERGGNVADAAVTTILCEGIATPQR